MALRTERRSFYPSSRPVSVQRVPAPRFARESCCCRRGSDRLWHGRSRRKHDSSPSRNRRAHGRGSVVREYSGIRRAESNQYSNAKRRCTGHSRFRAIELYRPTQQRSHNCRAVVLFRQANLLAKRFHPRVATKLGVSLKSEQPPHPNRSRGIDSNRQHSLTAD